MATKKTSIKKGDTVKSEMTKASYSSLILKPLFTEKAAMQNAHRVYTFAVQPKATKNEIKKAVEALFHVVPVKVTTQVLKPMAITFRGRKGTSKGGKKACVYLKEGDVINFA